VKSASNPPAGAVPSSSFPIDHELASLAAQQEYGCRAELKSFIQRSVHLDQVRRRLLPMFGWTEHWAARSNRARAQRSKTPVSGIPAPTTAPPPAELAL